MALLLFIGLSADAQTLINANTYRFNAANSAAVGITPTQLIGAGADNIASAVTPIGFTFWLAGTPYTQFSVDENGLMKLGNTVIIPEPVNNMASSTNLPKIAPYWDDLATGTNGSVGYQLSGTAPTRILYVTWNVTVPKNTAGASNATFQVQLYETGDIFFASPTATFPANSNGYSMGIGVAANDFASVTVTATQTSSTCAYGTANNTNTLSLGSGKRYQFSVDKSAPTILSVTSPHDTLNGKRSLTATIADQAGSPVSGIPTTGSFVPRIYFKKGAGGTYFSTPGILETGNGTTGKWIFIIDHSMIAGGVAPGDQIFYYLIAQDQGDYKGNPNIKSEPIGAVATNVNTVATPPTTLLSYWLPISFTGTVTVGSGGAFSSLTNAGGLFDQINAGQLTGNLTVNIIGDLTAETGLKGLNAWTNGPGGPFTMTINPVGNRTISGVTVNGGTANVITLNGVTGFTIDGLNSGGNSLTIVQTGQYYVGAVIELKGSSNTTITRTTVRGYGASNSGVAITATPSASGNNTVSYCTITTSVVIPNASNTGHGITLANQSTGTIVTADHNIVDNNTITDFVYNGIMISGKFSNTVISNNDIYNTVGTAWNNNYRGITVGGAVVGTTNVFNNKLHDLLVQTNASSAGIPAILSSGPVGTTTNIYNNVIYLDATYTHPMQTWQGIQTTGAGAVNIYYNSIYIGGTNITAVTTYGSYGIKKEGAGTTTAKNNAIFNARSNSTGTGKHYGIYNATGTIVSDYNDIYVTGTGGYSGFHTADQATLTAWQTATSNDIHSYSADPGFTSSTDLQPNVNDIKSATLNGHGIPIASIGVDILGNPRSTALPTMTDIGAYEFTMTGSTYTIFGNTGIGGVTLNWTDGGPQSITSNAATGDYAITVSSGWSGTVTPSLTGYAFTPASRTYTNVLTDQTAQNFTASAVTFTISGNAGAPGAILGWTDGTPKTDTADGTGNYAIAVSYNWSGTVTPSLLGYTFLPANRTYTNVLADQSAQNFTAAGITFTISGRTGVSGATLSWTDTTAKTAASIGVNGDYTITVSYNWSGTITPTLAGNIFVPAQRTYTNVVSNLSGQDYTTRVLANIRVMLEGPFAGGVMTTDLNTGGLLPLSSESAYPAATFGYTARSVTGIPNASIVDWILVELRTGTAAGTKVLTLAGFLGSNGTIVDTNGTSPLVFAVSAGSYYIVVRHRNHLPIMSAAPVSLSDAGTLYDFTSALTQAYGTTPMKNLGADLFAMYAGNNDTDLLISTNDYNAVGLSLFANGYRIGDHNMNGNIFVDDYNFVGSNLFRVTQVP